MPPTGSRAGDETVTSSSRSFQPEQPSLRLERALLAARLSSAPTVDQWRRTDGVLPRAHHPKPSIEHGRTGSSASADAVSIDACTNRNPSVWQLWSRCRRAGAVLSRVRSSGAMADLRYAPNHHRAGSSALHAYSTCRKRICSGSSIPHAKGSLVASTRHQRSRILGCPTKASGDSPCGGQSHHGNNVSLVRLVPDVRLHVGGPGLRGLEFDDSHRSLARRMVELGDCDGGASLVAGGPNMGCVHVSRLARGLPSVRLQAEPRTPVQADDAPTPWIPNRDHGRRHASLWRRNVGSLRRHVVW